MKRILAVSFALVLVLCMSAFSVSAAETYELIPVDATWTTVPCEGYDVTVNVTESEAVFSADAYWPCAETQYGSNVIKVSVDDYSLVYDFNVDTGNTNINFYLSDGFGSSATYTICNNTLGDVTYDAGSGDLAAGNYAGVIKLSDFVNSTAFLGSSPFPAAMITADNELIFTGIQVYSVSGATVTIRELALVPNDEATVPDNGDESSDADVESSEPAVESSEASDDSSVESDVESSAATTESSTASSAADSSAAESSEAEEGGLGTGAIIAIVVAAVAVIAVVVIVLVKKKK
ncbi:MAG: hypothetical protein IKK70_01455 [Clostridia bacterium]|nr:hypothetical protein [Clostridia bacterium]